MQKLMNPGDTVITVNGDLFICMTLRELEDKLKYAISAYGAKYWGYCPKDGGFIGWRENGDSRADSSEYKVIQVIPKEQAIAWIDSQEQKEDPRKGRELSLCQYQSKRYPASWHNFLDEKHYEETVKDGLWNIRYLSVD